MKQYILHRTFVSQNGSVYHKRAKPYYACELPELALNPNFTTLVDDGTILVKTSVAAKNVEEKHYNGLPDSNVLSQHFEPEYHTFEQVEQPTPTVDLSSWNSPDHIIEGKKEVCLGTATVEEIAALPYVSKKAAEKLVATVAEGTIFSSMADIDTFHKLGFGKSWADTGLVLGK